MRVIIKETEGTETFPIGTVSTKEELANLIKFSKRAAALGAAPDFIILERESE